MIAARREALACASHGPSTHAGLWLDRFLGQQPETPADRVVYADLHGVAASTAAPDGYASAFRRWTDPAENPGAMFFPATCSGRLVLGLGSKGPSEVGITLNRTWGMPVLPGSALKGLARRAAQRAGAGWESGGRNFRALFGSATGPDAGIGVVDFLDAWWDPASVLNGQQARPIYADVMTTHHQGYYGGKPGHDNPSDADDPIPVSFVSTTGKFQIGLAGPADWVEAAAGMLKIGLEELGVGAKTNAGYGRMVLDLGVFEAVKARRVAAEAQRLAAAEEAQAATAAMEATRAAEETARARALAAEVRTQALLSAGDDVPDAAGVLTAWISAGVRAAEITAAIEDWFSARTPPPVPNLGRRPRTEADMAAFYLVLQQHQQLKNDVHQKTKCATELAKAWKATQAKAAPP